MRSCSQGAAWWSRSRGGLPADSGDELLLVSGSLGVLFRPGGGGVLEVPGRGWLGGGRYRFGLGRVVVLFGPVACGGE